ncbi:MAG: hypothetical protein KJ063_18440 [Anaerolineae bacterium]|nr:hypothetical protein [Anaerolineae bacterium]
MRFGFTLTQWPGVYQSHNPMLNRVTLIVLAELSDESHNAFVKCFATQKKAKKQAFQTLTDVGFSLVEITVVTYLLGLQQLWFKGEQPMNSEITPEKVMGWGEQWLELILNNMPPEKILAHYPPQQLLSKLKPEERLMGLHPEERLMGLRREEIEAYLQKLNNGGVEGKN